MISFFVGFALGAVSMFFKDDIFSFVKKIFGKIF